MGRRQSSPVDRPYGGCKYGPGWMLRLLLLARRAPALTVALWAVVVVLGGTMLATGGFAATSLAIEAFAVVLAMLAGGA